MELRWTNEAVERLKEIEEYIARDNSHTAATFIDSLIDYTALLSDHPFAGRIVPELDNPSIREVLFHRYRVIYLVGKSMINILSVFEGHRQMKTTDIVAHEEDF